jgi:hypothetical protein
VETNGDRHVPERRIATARQQAHSEETIGLKEPRGLRQDWYLTETRNPGSRAHIRSKGSEKRKRIKNVAVGRARVELATPGLKGRTSNSQLSLDITPLDDPRDPAAPRIAPSFIGSSPDPVTRALFHAARSWIGGCSIVSLRRNLLGILLSLEDDPSSGTITTIAKPRQPGN